MNSYRKGGLIFLSIIFVSMFAGAFIFQAAFFGALTLLGLVVLIESIPLLRWLCMRTSRVIDVCIFLFSIAAIAQYGLTIAASLTVAGLGYTLVYAPYLRERKRLSDHYRKSKVGNARDKFKIKN